MHDPELDAAYENAITHAKGQLMTGEIRHYMASKDDELGRVIHVETDQGWNPRPIYMDNTEMDSGYSE
jgi:anti-sigma regulatory factor (Ser/Thr protein kinase)